MSTGELIVCEPRRNVLIAKDGDTDDPLDAERLAQLRRVGYRTPAGFASYSPFSVPAPTTQPYITPGTENRGNSGPSRTDLSIPSV